MMKTMFLQVLFLLPSLVQCTSHVRSKHAPTIPLIALPVILLSTVPFRMLIYRYDLKIPNQIFWIPHAILYATLIHAARIDLRYKAFLDLDWTYLLTPKWIIAIYFPGACFRMAFKMDLHVLKRSNFQIFCLTVIAGVLNIILMGVLMKYTLNHGWTMSMAIVFGASITIIEAAHGSQVVNEMDKYKHLITVLEGESLIGTATSTIILDLAMAIQTNVLTTWLHMFSFLARQIGIGTLYGYIGGYCGRFGILRLHNDRLGILGIAFICVYMAFYMSEVDGGSGALASVVVSLKISAERARYGNDIDKLLFTFWESMLHICKPYFVVSILGICLERLYDIGFHDYSRLAHLIVVYFMATVTRMLGFMVVSPVVSRTGYGADFKSIVFLMWTPQRSVVSLLCALTIFHDIRLQGMAVETMADISALFLLTLLVNAITAPFLLNYLKFTEISTMKRTNMNSCMKYIMEKRRHVISLLKMNRFLSDANWPLVLNVTWLKHPYKLNTTYQDEDQLLDDDMFGDTRASYCSECESVVQIDPTPKEYAEMTKEARLRVLKSEKVSYIRQYEKGLLSQEGIRSLLQAVEVALDSSDLTIKLDDYFKIIRKRNLYDIVKKCVMRLTRKVAQTRRKPKTKFRKACYVTANHNYFPFLHIVVIVVHMVMEVLYFALSGLWEPANDNMATFIAYAIMVFFELLYISIITIKVSALSYLNVSEGIKSYFKDCLNILDFASFIARTSCIIALITTYTVNGKSNAWMKISNIYYYIVILKSLQFFTIIIYLGPNIIRMCDQNYDIRIAYAYEIGHCLVNGYGEVADMLAQMVRNKKIRDIIHKQLDADRLAITRELGLMHKFSPWIAVSTKTRQAIKTTLNHLRQTVDELKTSGFLDDYEYFKLQDSIEDRMRVLRNLKTVELSSPKSLFKEMQWLQNEYIGEYLYDQSSTRVWDAGNVICENGGMSGGIYVLVTGLFKLVYEPDKEFIKFQKETGVLPIVDYLATTKFDDTIQDYIFAGNSLGELCVLTQRPYNCKIVAEVPSQAFVLSERMLQLAATHDTHPIHGLECRLWKYVAINIAVSMLQETVIYQSYTQDQIRLLLENAFLPNLAAYKVLVLHEQVHDIILIDGIVYDLVTAERYTAPCYIPRTAQRLVIHQNKDFTKFVKLMILPDKDVDQYELMDKLEDMGDLDSDASDSVVLNPKRLRLKKTIPIFSTRRVSLANKGRQRMRDSIMGSEEHSEVDDPYRQSMAESIVYDPYSINDSNYKNRGISTMSINRKDAGFSKAKVLSASDNALVNTTDLFTLNPSSQQQVKSKDELRPSFPVVNNVRRRTILRMEKERGSSPSSDSD